MTVLSHYKQVIIANNDKNAILISFNHIKVFLEFLLTITTIVPH